MGWKTIETRTHRRFECLLGQRIAIHGGLKWDDEAFEAAAPWLDAVRRAITNGLRAGHQLVPMTTGAIYCTALVTATGRLNAAHSEAAMIDCSAGDRFGLWLSDVQLLPHIIPVRGHQGIWNINLKKHK